jgi:hypothetical protein
MARTPEFTPAIARPSADPFTGFYTPRGQRVPVYRMGDTTTVRVGTSRVPRYILEGLAAVLEDPDAEVMYVNELALTDSERQALYVRGYGPVSRMSMKQARSIILGSTGVQVQGLGGVLDWLLTPSSVSQIATTWTGDMNRQHLVSAIPESVISTADKAILASKGFGPNDAIVPNTALTLIAQVKAGQTVQSMAAQPVTGPHAAIMTTLPSDYGAMVVTPGDVWEQIPQQGMGKYLKYVVYGLVGYLALNVLAKARR